MVARAVYAANLPFRIVNNKHFRNLLLYERPDVKIPSRSSLAGKLLDAEYDAQRLLMKQRFMDANVTVAIDSWTSPTNVPSISMSRGLQSSCLHVCIPQSLPLR